MDSEGTAGVRASPAARPVNLDAATLMANRSPGSEQPAMLDQRSGAILTLSGILFTVIAKFAPQMGVILRTPGHFRYLFAAVLIAFALCAVGTVLQVFRTIAPRFPGGPRSLAFYETIAHLPLDQYVAEMEAVTPEGALEHVMAFNHTQARIVVEKHRQFRRCTRLFRAAFCCWILVVLTLTAGTVRAML